MGYARQAGADLDTYEVLQRNPSIPECHRLLFLQMTCEKLAKACLCQEGSDPKDLQGSHAYTAGKLPTIIRREIRLRGLKPKTAKKSIQTEVSTTIPFTGFAQVDGQMELSFQGHCFVVRAAAADPFQPFDQGFGNALAGHRHRVIQQIFRDVGSNPFGRHDVHTNVRHDERQAARLRWPRDFQKCG